MSNPYYGASGNPVNLTRGASPLIRAEFIMVQTAFDRLNANFTGFASAITLSYIFDSSTTDGDPGSGNLRLSSATQNSSTVIRADLLDSNGVDWTSVLDTFDASSSLVKGQVRLSKVGDGTKFLTFNLTARAAPSGYRNLTVTNTGSSSANPFTAGDGVYLAFTRTGDVGSSGTIVRRTASITSSATPTPDSTNTDLYEITALATAPTFGAPTGTPANGQGLEIRVKDNGTSRALAFNTIYRAGTDLALPTATVISKWTYMGFIYNAVDTRWDLVAVLGNI